MKFQTPRGTHDVLPSESFAWQHAERTFAALVHLYGYREIRTPMFEDTDLFVRTSGDTSDIVTKQMFQFTDKGGRDITLKPEGTAPAVRSYLEHHLGEPNAVTRLWYFTPVFRYERPMKGRYRQHHQLGVEMLGSSSPEADAEVMEIAVRFYERLGLKELKILVNCIGRAETRGRYRDAILEHAKSYLQGLDEEQRARAERNPLRLLDSKDPEAVELMASAPSILDYLEESSQRHFDRLLQALTDASLPFEVKPQIVRGLDYYTDTVFEIQSSDLGAQSALCGGGRYDGLVKSIGGPDTPAVGLGMGVERLMIVLEALGLLPKTPPLDAFVVAATESARAAVRELVREIRHAGFSVNADLDGRNLKQQFKLADKSGARLALVIGDDELQAGTVSVRHLADGSQRAVSRGSILEALG